MKKYKWVIILLNLLLLLGYFNWSVIHKEETLANGKLVLLELAPIDPRSLMQGDYMQLSYAIDNFRDEQVVTERSGYCVVKLNEHGIAERVRLQASLQPLNNGESLIKYRSKNQWGIQIGAESCFFEEGQSGKLSKAKYGGLRVDDQGNSILVGLYNEQFELLNP